MLVNILPFGRFLDFMKSPTVISEAKDTDSLKRILFDLHPELRDSTFLFAINKKVVIENTTLHENDEVAIMPPFSGG
jgi:molybdopterin converting factor small subunit